MEAGERLEDDEDLKLFAMGHRSLFTEWLSQIVAVMITAHRAGATRNTSSKLCLLIRPRLIDTNHGRSISHLPTRWLQPSCVKSLWFQFGGPGSSVSCRGRMSKDVDQDLLCLLCYQSRLFA